MFASMKQTYRLRWFREQLGSRREKRKQLQRKIEKSVQRCDGRFRLMLVGFYWFVFEKEGLYWKPVHRSPLCHPATKWCESQVARNGTEKTA